VTSVRLAGALWQGAAIDTSVSGDFVVVPPEMIEDDDLVLRVASHELRELGIERGDLLIVERRADGRAATAELVVATLRDRAYVGRWWRKHDRRALLDHALVPVVEDEDLCVIGAIVVVMRESLENSRRR
jgi:SOS-response transcriptional repressor LexA